MSTAEDKLMAFDGLPTFGGPSKIEVVTDIGLSGERGSYFFLSNGDPNDSTDQNKIIWATFPDEGSSSEDKRILIPSEKFKIFVKRYDVCISIKANDPSFLRVFHYSDGAEGTRWYEILNISPPGLSTIFEVTFTSGQSTLTLPGLPAPQALADIIAAQSVQPGFNLEVALAALSAVVKEIINFQINIQHTRPTASTITPNTSFPSPITLFYDTSSTVSLGGILSSTSPNLVTLTSGDTKTLSVGEKLTKNSGTGVFGTDAIITKIISNTAFEVSASHTTSGSLGFEANFLKLNFYYLLRASELLVNGSWAQLSRTEPYRLHFIAGVGQIPTV